MMKKCIYLAMHLLFALYIKCTSSAEYFTMFSLFSDLSGFVCPSELILFEKTVISMYVCMFMCLNDGSCKGIDYTEDTNMCHGCKGLEEANCLYEPMTFSPTTGTRMYAKEIGFLVSGILPISNDDLSVSTYHDVYSDVKMFNSYYSRYCKLEYSGGSGGWTAKYQDTNQWIQAQFLGHATVRGIHLLAQYPHGWEYVKSYKLLSSTDCSQFQYYMANGTEIVFPGNTNAARIITTILPSPVIALCVRIAPMSWHEKISLRFDVIGDYL